MRLLPRPRLALALLVAAFGCTSADAAGQANGAIDAPRLHPGDRWTYHVVEGYRQKMTWNEVHEVTAAAPDAITIAVTIEGPRGRITREEALSGPGVVRSGAITGTETKRFEPALIRYRFPLASGERWSQRVRDIDKPPGPYGDISFKATVVGREGVTTPAGKFDAVKIRYVYQLDDESLTNHPTQCEYVVWYSAAVGAAVKEQRRSWAMTKGVSPVRTPAENAVYELTSFSHAE